MRMREWFGYIPGANIERALRQLAEVVECYDWVFVALDSCRGRDLARCEPVLSARLETVGVHCMWCEGGFRIAGTGIQPTLAAKILTPFAAVYVFPKEAGGRTVPSYNLTSESETFETGVPDQLRSAVSLTGSVGYLSDGQGLNYYFTSESLGRALLPIVT
jgi:hypothetical protein